MNPEHRVSQSNPVRDLGHLDYERCAALHNEIFHRGWVGSGKDWNTFHQKTWWDRQSIHEAEVNCLPSSLVEFLKRAYWLAEYEECGDAFSYYLHNLPTADLMLSFFTFIDPDRYITLYYATGFKFGNELGLVFDRDTEKTTLVADFDDAHRQCPKGLGWWPLEVILTGYLEMIDEGKIVAVPEPGPFVSRGAYGKKYPLPIFCDPWGIHTFTQVDLEKAVSAMRRLLDAIDARIDDCPGDTKACYKLLPWGEVDVLEKDYLPPFSFAYEFLSAISQWKVRFRYIAPGIRLPTVSEFLDQSQYHPRKRYSGDLPAKYFALRIFRVDDESGSTIPQSHPADARPPGFYITPVMGHGAFNNTCELVLLFSLGAKGWARLSDGQRFGETPKDMCTDLYQSGYNGLTDIRNVQIHKVLQSWAERVEQGDWEVTPDGVGGGCGKFREADTEAHWEKYWILPTW